MRNSNRYADDNAGAFLILVIIIVCLAVGLYFGIAIGTAITEPVCVTQEQEQANDKN